MDLGPVDLKALDFGRILDLALISLNIQLPAYFF
jgi:hypothetical protein